MQAPRTGALTSLFIPAPQSPAEPPSTRLMVVLHGLGDSAEGFTFLPQELGLPRVNFLLLNAPERYYIGYAWYDLDDPEPGILASRAKLQALLRDLEAQGWPSADTLLFGFSQGCLMCVDVALRHGRPLAGIVGISGYVGPTAPQAPQDVHEQARRQAWLITHGTEDELLPIARSREQFQRLKALGLPIEWHEFAKGHTLDPHRELPLLREWIAGRWPDPPVK